MWLACSTQEACVMHSGLGSLWLFQLSGSPSSGRVAMTGLVVGYLRGLPARCADACIVVWLLFFRRVMVYKGLGLLIESLGSCDSIGARCSVRGCGPGTRNWINCEMN